MGKTKICESEKNKYGAALSLSVVPRKKEENLWKKEKCCVHKKKNEKTKTKWQKFFTSIAEIYLLQKYNVYDLRNTRGV